MNDTMYTIRPIQQSDNATVAKIIRTVMTEYACVGEGYSINDPEVYQMFEAFSAPNTAFFVLASAADVLGCAGIAPLKGGDGSVCELQKMYFLPAARGKGFGKKMLQTCLEAATQLGYGQCYLETVARMDAANQLYQSMGFEKLEGALGNTGHCSCDLHYVKKI